MPDAVNEFLRQEHEANSQQVALLQQQSIGIDPIEFSTRCLPQWDFRQTKREVVWFYHYQSARTPAGHPITVFGAVDGLGSSLFRFPRKDAEPIALLDSQYVGLKWGVPGKASHRADSRVERALGASRNGPRPLSSQ